jgi:hypothetical protein
VADYLSREGTNEVALDARLLEGKDKYSVLVDLFTGRITLGELDLKTRNQMYSLLKKFYWKHEQLWKRRNLLKDALVVLTVEEQKSLVRKVHLAGHFGVRANFASLSQEVWWEGMYGDIEAFIKECHQCQTFQKLRKTEGHGVLPPPSGLFTAWSFDFMGPYEVTADGHKYILNGVCRSSRFLVSKAVTECTGKEFWEFLCSEIILKYGLPENILTDRGSGFLKLSVQSAIRLLGIKPLKTTAYNPQRNGLCERANGTLKTILRKLCAGKQHLWDKFLQTAVYYYQIHVNEELGFSPYFFVFGKQPRVLTGDESFVHNAQDQCRLRVKELNQLESLREANVSRDESRFGYYQQQQKTIEEPKPGMSVLLHRSALSKQLGFGLESPYSGPFVVQKIYPNGNCRLQDLNGVLQKTVVNKRRLVPYHFPSSSLKGELCGG